MKNNHQDVIDKLVSQWNKERPDLDPNAMNVVGRIIKLGKTFEKRVGAAIKSSNIHYTDLDVLATLRRSGEPYQLTPKELMESVLITSGAMTSLLVRLTKLELIYRADDEKDGRIKKACLTGKGKRLIDEVIAIRFKEASDSVKGLSSIEQEELSLLLKKLLHFLE